MPQPIGKLDGGPDGQGMRLAYSLGNLISNQQPDDDGVGVATGVFATATIEAGSEGPAHVSGLDWTAVIVDLATHRTYLLSTLESGAVYSTLSPGQLAERRAVIDSVMGTPEQTALPVASATLLGQEKGGRIKASAASCRSSASPRGCTDPRAVRGTAPGR